MRTYAIRWAAGMVLFIAGSLATFALQGGYWISYLILCFVGGHLVTRLARTR